MTASSAQVQPSAGPTVGTELLRGLAEALSRLSSVDDPDRTDQLRLLEEIKGAAAGAQARITVDLAASQRARQQAAGVPAARVGQGIAAQVALARRDSPARGARHLGLAQALCEMAHTAHALDRGLISEWRATIIARETACLTRPDRVTADAELAARPGGLEMLGDRATEAEARTIAYRLDPRAFTARAAKAAAERSVTLRPAPDTMSYLTGHLPVREGVAVHAALSRHADRLRGQGDARSRGQIMADTLVERVTGQAAAHQPPMEVHLVMTDAALLDGDQTPVHVQGYGPVPAPLAREWLADPDTEAWVRRLYAAPGTGQVVAMDSSRRVFAGGLRRFIQIRDRVCRTPWCGAPIRHVDHVAPVAAGGRTTAGNSQGLCEACNYAKQAPGWRAHTSPGGPPGDLAGARRGGAGRSVVTRTPTGATYTGLLPPGIAVTGAGPPARLPPGLELQPSFTLLTA